MYVMFCVGCRIQESGMSRFFTFQICKRVPFCSKKGGVDVSVKSASAEPASLQSGVRRVFVNF